MDHLIKAPTMIRTGRSFKSDSVTYIWKYFNYPVGTVPRLVEFCSMMLRNSWEVEPHLISNSITSTRDLMIITLLLMFLSLEILFPSRLVCTLRKWLTYSKQFSPGDGSPPKITSTGSLISLLNISLSGVNLVDSWTLVRYTNISISNSSSHISSFPYVS